jgi:phosphoadenosine phosphosulfate reductase
VSLALAEADLEQAAAQLEAAAPQEIVAWALRRFGAARTAVVTGLQAEGVAVADMAILLDPSVRVVTIDTGRLPAESCAYIDSLRQRWGRGIEVIHPDATALSEFTTNNGVNAFYTSVQLRLDCCHVRKVEPLERALRGVDAWMTGLRRSQSDRRGTTPVVERDIAHGDIVKLNPVAAWSEEQVVDYLRSRDVPRHPLYEQGYRSIGCAPCTRAVGPGEHPRAGRWWWESSDVEKECGIHHRPQVEQDTTTIPGSAS